MPGLAVVPGSAAKPGWLEVPGLAVVPGSAAEPGWLEVPGLAVVPGSAAEPGWLAVPGWLEVPGLAAEPAPERETLLLPPLMKQPKAQPPTDWVVVGEVRPGVTARAELAAARWEDLAAEQDCSPAAERGCSLAGWDSAWVEAVSPQLPQSVSWAPGIRERYLAYALSASTYRLGRGIRDQSSN